MLATNGYNNIITRIWNIWNNTHTHTQKKNNNKKRVAADI